MAGGATKAGIWLARPMKERASPRAATARVVLRRTAERPRRIVCVAVVVLLLVQVHRVDHDVGQRQLGLAVRTAGAVRWHKRRSRCATLVWPLKTINSTVATTSCSAACSASAAQSSSNMALTSVMVVVSVTGAAGLLALERSVRTSFLV